MNAFSALPERKPFPGHVEEALGAFSRAAVVLAVLPCIAGCAASGNWAREPLPVSVSAANYSRLSYGELYARVHDPDNARPEVPAVQKAAEPLYYFLVPGEIYPNDVPLDTVYRELENALESRGYFNVVYQLRAGRMPPRIDYLLRVHYGVRLWLRPIVRTDKITWGNDGIVANRYMAFLQYDPMTDPRVGLSPEEIARLHAAFAHLAQGASGPGANTAQALAFGSEMDDRLSREFGQEGKVSRDFCLVVVEAFKFDDVRATNRKAPCIWATFIAVPVEEGMKFSNVLRAMLRTAQPYFGETTHGLQVYEVPPGRVLMGTPVELPTPLKASAPTGQKPP